MRIKFILAIVVAITLFSCKQEDKVIYMFSSFREPATDGLYYAYSEDGYHWNDLGGSWLKPEVGTQKLMRDPSVVQGKDGTYHMVWTSSWKGDLGFGYASSKDLINWSEQKQITAMTDTSTVNVWAPELFYDDVKDEYIIIWASTVPFKFEKGIEDERNNHRMYYLTTKDFVSFSETKLFYDPGFSVIDCVIVKRAADDYVLILKDNTRPNRYLQAAVGKSPIGPWTDITEPFSGLLTEGPTVEKVGNDYLIYYDFYGEKRYAAARTNDFKTFEDVSTEISLPQGHKHGTIFKTSEPILENLLKEATNRGFISTQK
ncbi:MAG: glycoside hydrolase family 43 protein [Mangrovibacterium sp.]